MEPSDSDKTKLVANERAKLTATFMNGVAIAAAAVGGLAPLSSAVLGGATLTSIGLVAIMSTFGLALAMHVFARRLLGRLEP